MKILSNFLICVLSLVTLYSCGGGSATPVAADLQGYTVTDLKGTNASLAQKFNELGKVLENGYVINGHKSGQWTTYDGKDKIKTIVNYIAGLKNGEELTFNTRGQIESKASYVNDVLDGLSGTYKNGRPVKEVFYKNGKFDGPTREYFNNGKLQRFIAYKEGKQHGALKYYDEEGNVTLEYKYSNGNKIGEAIVRKKVEE